MRNLTLNEKITIKGILDRYGVASENLVNMEMGDACYFFGRCTGTSIKYYGKYVGKTRTCR